MAFILNRIKTKAAKELRLKVEYEAGEYSNNPRWSNKGMRFSLCVQAALLTRIDLDPVPPEQHTWGGKDYWVSTISYFLPGIITDCSLSGILVL